MFFIIYLLFGLLIFIPVKTIFTTFLSVFSISVFIMLIFYYTALLIFIMKNKDKILKTYSIPLYIFSSNLTFPNIFSNFFFSLINIIIITDKQKIIFKCKNGIFYTSPFFAGKHYIKSFFIKITDPLYFFTINIKLNKKIFYNFFIQSKEYKINFYNNAFNKNLEEKKIKDDSIILRDYLSGDDPRKIFWKSYAIMGELKIREDWFEKSTKKNIKIALSGIYNINFYYITEHLLKKIFIYILKLLDLGFEITLFNKKIETRYIYLIEKTIYDLLESEYSHNFYENNVFDLVFFSVFNKFKIHGKNYIFLKCFDFFSKITINSLKTTKNTKKKYIKQYFFTEYYKYEKNVLKNKKSIKII